MKNVVFVLVLSLFLLFVPLVSVFGYTSTSSQLFNTSIQDAGLYSWLNATTTGAASGLNVGNDSDYDAWGLYMYNNISSYVSDWGENHTLLSGEWCGYIVVNNLDSGEAINVSAYLVYSNFTVNGGSWDEGNSDSSCVGQEVCWGTRPNVSLHEVDSVASGVVQIDDTDVVNSSVCINFTRGLNTSLNLVEGNVTVLLRAVVSNGSPSMSTSDWVTFYTKEITTVDPVGGSGVLSFLNFTYSKVLSSYISCSCSNQASGYNHSGGVYVANGGCSYSNDIAPNVSVRLNTTFPGVSVDNDFYILDLSGGDIPWSFTDYEWYLNESVNDSSIGVDYDFNYNESFVFPDGSLANISTITCTFNFSDNVAPNMTNPVTSPTSVSSREGVWLYVDIAELDNVSVGNVFVNVTRIDPSKNMMSLNVNNTFEFLFSDTEVGGVYDVLFWLEDDLGNFGGLTGTSFVVDDGGGGSSGGSVGGGGGSSSVISTVVVNGSFEVFPELLNTYVFYPLVENFTKVFNTNRLVDSCSVSSVEFDCVVEGDRVVFYMTDFNSTSSKLFSVIVDELQLVAITGEVVRVPIKINITNLTISYGDSFYFYKVVIYCFVLIFGIIVSNALLKKVLSKKIKRVGYT